MVVVHDRERCLCSPTGCLLSKVFGTENPGRVENLDANGITTTAKFAGIKHSEKIRFLVNAIMGPI